VVIAVLTGTVPVARNAGEPYLSLAIPAVVGSVVACCVCQFVIARLGFGPTLALGTATTAVAAIVIVPYLVRGVGTLAGDRTLYEWMRQSPTREPLVSTGLLAWLGLALAAVAVGRLVPRDVSALRWISRESTISD
jgi:hypothetical protein